jgi:CRP-like cAMP-binding protein
MSQLLLVGEPSRAGLRDRVLLLRAQPMFEGLDDDGLLLLAEHARTASYHDGEVIAAEGEASRAVYLVAAGEIVVSRHGKELTVRKAGDAYGGLPLLAREASTLAVARGETRTYEVPATAFESAVTENYSLLRNMLRVMGSSVLATRASLPADPQLPRVVDEGIYHTEPRSMVERLLELRRSPFGHLNLEALVDLARQMVEVRYPAGHLLWSAGDVSTHSLHIDAGRVRCTAPDGSSVAVGHGFTIGVLDVWGSHVRVYEARAETPVIASRIDFERFIALLEAHPEVGLELLRGFARELLGIHQRP